MFGGFNMFHDVGRPFNNQYKCFSVALLPGNERADVERGGKIIMPPSALDQLTRLNIVYPMLFKLTNKKTKRETHCGVLEFVADEGKGEDSVGSNDPTLTFSYSATGIILILIQIRS